MLTLQQLKQIVDVPVPGGRNPTIRKVKESSREVIQTKLEGNTEITVFESGYAIYRVGCAATVFPIHSCGAYLYDVGGMPCCIDRAVFEDQAWYLRLVLEGEDRLYRNQETKQWRNTVSYQEVPEEWRIVSYEDNPILAQIIQEETITELLEVLTKQQKDVICRFFLGQKSQKQIANELGVSMPAVSKKLSRAVKRIQREKAFPLGGRKMSGES